MLYESPNSVTELNFYVKSLLENDEVLQSIYVVGEISNLKVHSSGHVYLSLKDEKCSVKCVIFSKYSKGIEFSLKNGISIFAYGSVSCYEPSGQYQLYIYHISPAGIGTINESLEKLYNKLESEGLFDDSRKRNLKKFPKKVGVISSKTGAVIHDISSVLNRRFPIAEIVLCSVNVQGENASNQISKAIDKLQTIDGIDVLIIARGGGSLEDLWVFNSEKVIRKMVDCKIPIISAVGHEVDFTLCDYAADVRAATPSVAAELASENVKDILARIGDLKRRIQSSLKNRLIWSTIRLENLKKRISTNNILSLVENKSSRIISCKEKMQFGILTLLKNKFFKLENLKTRLGIFDPEKIFKKGYSLLKFQGRNVSSIEQIQNGYNLELVLYDGIAKFVIQNLEKEYKIGKQNF